jgi:hypothetical protein
LAKVAHVVDITGAIGSQDVDLSATKLSSRETRVVSGNALSVGQIVGFITPTAWRFTPK